MCSSPLNVRGLGVPWAECFRFAPDHPIAPHDQNAGKQSVALMNCAFSAATRLSAERLSGQEKRVFETNTRHNYFP